MRAVRVDGGTRIQEIGHDFTLIDDYDGAPRNLQSDHIACCELLSCATKVSQAFTHHISLPTLCTSPTPVPGEAEVNSLTQVDQAVPEATFLVASTAFVTI